MPDETGGELMTVTAALLVGGESRRMGMDKATLIFKGEPLWQRQLRILRELRPERLVLSARAQCPWKPAEIELVIDTPPSRGPLSGIAAALGGMPTSHLLVLAVDLPFMTTCALQKISASAGPDRGAVPVVDGRAEPLAAVYPAGARAEFTAALAGSNWSLQPLIRSLAEAGTITLMEVSKGDTAVYRNFNQPADLELKS